MTKTTTESVVYSQLDNPEPPVVVGMLDFPTLLATLGEVQELVARSLGLLEVGAFQAADLGIQFCTTLRHIDSLLRPLIPAIQKGVDSEKS